MIKVEMVKRYDIAMVRNNPNKLFIFGDNLLGYGKGGQAIIRDEKNAYGIPTKKSPNMSEASFFTDEEFEDNKKILFQIINDIPISDYEYVVLPEDGLGTGLAMLPTKAPKTFIYLYSKLTEKLFSEDGLSNED